MLQFYLGLITDWKGLHLKIYCHRTRDALSELLRDKDRGDEVEAFFHSLQERSIRFCLVQHGNIVFSEKVVLPEDDLSPVSKQTILFLYKQRWAEETVLSHFTVVEHYD